MFSIFLNTVFYISEIFTNVDKQKLEDCVLKSGM